MVGALDRLQQLDTHLKRRGGEENANMQRQDRVGQDYLPPPPPDPMLVRMYAPLVVMGP